MSTIYLKNIIKETQLKEIILATNEQIELTGFLNLLTKYYQNASTVIYANVDNFNAENYKVYLKIKNDWTALYISKNNSTDINFYPSGDILTKFPEKYQHLILLKNPINDVYSTRNSGSETFSSTPDDLTLTNESKLEYPSNEKITISFFQKEKTFGTIVYTNLPMSFKGSAYFNLKIGEENFNFKEMGVKHIGFDFTVKHDLSYYVLPKKYGVHSKVSFLKVFPASNLLDTGSKGIYIVRPLTCK